MDTNSETSHKQRIRWTTELHDLFVEAVKALGGPETATPKSILGIVNVPGLTVCHVKSHLQKYRFAMDVQELKPETEALRTPIEVQKLLHEQLLVQRELQLRIKHNGELLEKLMKEQQKQKPYYS